MKGSCEIKINSISKPKIVFHKCANSVIKLHISSGGQTGPITRKKKGEPKMFQQSPEQELFFGSFAFSIVLLYSASVAVASVGAQAEGHLRFMKNSSGSRSEELSISSRTFGWSPQMLCLNA